MIEKITGYISESTAPAIGVASGIIGGTILANTIIEKFFKLTGGKATVGKILTRVGVGGYLFYWGRAAATTGQLLAKSAAIGMIAGIILDFAKQYGFAQALEKALIGKEIPEEKSWERLTSGKSAHRPAFESREHATSLESTDGALMAMGFIR